jgi:hypothetical protein
MPVAKRERCGFGSAVLSNGFPNLPFEDDGISLGFTLDDIEYADSFVRGACCEALAIEVELSVMLEISDQRLWLKRENEQSCPHVVFRLALVFQHWRIDSR